MNRVTIFLLFAATAMMCQEWPQVRLHRVASGLQNPTDIAAVPDGSGRMVVLEQPGRIRLIKNGQLLPTPFLSITDKTRGSGERGLLGIAFPPGFAGKQYFYVNYTDLEGHTIIARFRVSAGPDSADAQSEQVILRILQPYANHNGGQIVFGPDGYLYIGMGDGGSAGDPQNNAQRGDSLLGKMLRIDTESGTAPYAVPSSNPFVGRSEYRGEIWATGLRNPWRFSFDRESKDLWIADVGQNRAEEIHFTAAASRGGENYGWRIMEGLQCYNPSSGCNQQGLVVPVLEYGRDLGASVSGGFVYRGSRFPALRGIYFYGDYVSGRLWGIRRTGERWENRQFLQSANGFSTFGQDEAGELYVATYGGEIFLLAGGAPSTSAEGVVNAASFGAGVVPGSLATLFGQAITSLNGIVQATAFPLPTELAGTSVTMNGTRVPLIVAANVNGQEQINFQVPFELAGAGRASVVVTANGQSSAAVEIALAAVQPEIFAVTRSGDALTIWATGLGAVSNAPATGRAAQASPLSETIAQTQVTVGGANAQVSFSGLAPGFSGLYQVNAAVPAGTAADAEIVLRVGNVASRPWRMR